MTGGLTAFVFTSFFTGITGYVNALSAQYHGAGRPERCVQSASQGFWLCIVFYPLLLLLIPFGHGIFSWAGHGHRLVELEFSYYRILMLGSFLFLIQSVLTGYFLGLGKTKVIMIANLLGILVNVPLNWCLVFGRLGFPRMGIEGAAVGTLGGTLFILIVLFIAYLRDPGYRASRGLSAWAPRKVLLMDSYSANVAAAVTITFNYDLVAFIPQLGVGYATTALVGHRMGARDPDGARKAAFLGLRVAWGYGAIMVLGFLVGAPLLVGFFTGGFTASDQAGRDLHAR
jgi:MATE family multidrug resistance protein